MLEPLFAPTSEDYKKLELLYNKSLKNRKPAVKVYVDRQNCNVFLKALVTAEDWAGLVDTVAGALHEKGYNLEYLNSFSVKENDKLMGVVIALSDVTGKDLNTVEKDAKVLHNFIEEIARGGYHIKKVMVLGFEKLFIMLGIERALKKLVTREELKEIIGQNGELFYFVVSRSEAYLKERTPASLAKIVEFNYRAIKELRKVSRGIKVFVHNLRTRKGENLTGVSVAGFERDISMDDVFDAIRILYPHFVRMYDKQFTTEDGITVIRVEFFKEGKKPVKRDEIKLLKNHLESTLRHKRPRTPLNINLGPELFGRVVIPKLIEEVQSSGQTQVYIFPFEKDEQGNLLMMIGVVGKKDSKINYRQALTEAFSKSGKFELQNFRSALSPSKSIEIQIVTIKAKLSYFESEMDLYTELKHILESSIGLFRDFDEGMRKLDRMRLGQIMEHFKGTQVSERFIKSYYYSLDVFYRISQPLENIIEEIRFAHNLFVNYFKHNEKINMLVGHNRTYISIIDKDNETKLHKTLELLTPFNPTFTRLDIFGIVLYTFNFQIKEKDKLEKLKNIYEILKKEVINESNPISYKG